MIHLEKREERDNGQGRHSQLSIETQMCVHMCVGICFLGRSHCLCRSPEAKKGPYVGADEGLSILYLLQMVEKKLGASILLLLLTYQTRVHPSFSSIL